MISVSFTALVSEKESEKLTLSEMDASRVKALNVSNRQFALPCGLAPHPIPPDVIVASDAVTVQVEGSAFPSIHILP